MYAQGDNKSTLIHNTKNIDGMFDLFQEGDATELSEKLLAKCEDKLSNTTVDCMTLLSYQDAPAYLQFNPYILSGYRGFLSTKMCFERLVTCKIKINIIQLMLKVFIFQKLSV